MWVNFLCQAKLMKQKKHIPSYWYCIHFPKPSRSWPLLYSWRRAQNRVATFADVFLGIFWHRTALDRMKEFFDHLGNLATSQFQVMKYWQTKSWTSFSWSGKNGSVFLYLSERFWHWCSKTHSMVHSSMGLIGSFWEFYLLLRSIFRVQASEIAEPTKSLTHAGMNLTPRVEIQHFSLWLIVHGKINIHQPGLPEKVRGTRWWFQPIYIVNLDHFSRDRGENTKPLKQPPPIGKDYLTKPMSRLLNCWFSGFR